MRRFLALGAAALALLAAFAAPAQELPVPALATRVTDQAGALAANERDALEEKLRAFEQARGSQVAVLVVPTLGGETIEEFAGRTADAWKLGRKGVDDGVLFVVAMKERRMRIHTGRGVQGVLSDAVASRIVAEIVAPRFRAGDIAGGIDAGADAILKAIQGEALPAPSRKPAAGRGDASSSWGTYLVLALFLVPVVAQLMRSIFGRLLGAGVTSGLAGAAGWLLLGSIAVGVAFAFIAFLITLVSGAGFGRGARRGGWGGYVPSGGWSGGGGFGGGGGFSGGGGGFDGGGASGGW